LQIFANFLKLPKKTELPEKFEFLNKRGFELMVKRTAARFLPPRQPPFINWACHRW